jgi:hypothetical protein
MKRKVRTDLVALAAAGAALTATACGASASAHHAAVAAASSSPAASTSQASAASQPASDCGAQVQTWLTTKDPGYQRTVGKDLAAVVTSAQKISTGASYIDQIAYGAVIHSVAANIMQAPPMPSCADPQSKWTTFAGDVATAAQDTDADPAAVTADCQAISSDYQTLVSEASNAGVTITTS